MSETRNDEGIVLLLVLVLMLFTISIAFSFSRTTTLARMRTDNRDDRVRAEALARSGADLAVRAIADDADSSDDLVASIESPRDGWHLLTQQPWADEAGGELVFSIADAGSRINLNGLVDRDGQPKELAQAFLRAALERIVENMAGRDEEKFYEPNDLANAILDWLDSDETSLEFGDEEARAYERAVRPPLDRPLFSLGELAAVPGVDDLLIRALDHYFTTQPMFPDDDAFGINPNTAPPYLLALIFHGPAGDPDDLRLIEDDDVYRILKARDEGLVFCPAASDDDACVDFDDELGLAGELVFPPLAYRSDVFSIRTEATFGNGRACVDRVIDRTDGAMKTLFYRLGCE